MREIILMLSKIKSFFFHNTSDKQTIIKNTFWLMVGDFFQKGSIFLTTVLIARYLGPQEYGNFSFIMSFCMFFTFLMDYGLSVLFVRETAKNPEKIPTYIFHYTLIKILLGGVTFLFIFGISFFFEETRMLQWLILAYALYFIINLISEFLRTSFRSLEKMEKEARIKFLNTVLFLGIFFFIFFYKDFEIRNIILGYIVAGAVNLIINSLYIFRSFHFDFTWRREIFFEGLRKWLYLMSGQIFITVFIYMDQIMLGIYGMKEELGIYSAMYKLISLGSLFITLFIQSTIPNLLKKMTQRKIYSILGFLFFFWLISLLIVIFGGKIIISLIFGSAYLDGYLLFVILTGILFFISVDIFFYNFLNSIHKEKIVFYITVFAGVSNGILNLLLIPSYAAYGAVIATGISEIIMFIGMGWVFLRYLKKK